MSIGVCYIGQTKITLCDTSKITVIELVFVAIHNFDNKKIYIKVLNYEIKISRIVMYILTVPIILITKHVSKNTRIDFL